MKWKTGYTAVSPASASGAPRARGGFTLLEILLALSLVGLLLVGLNSFIFSMGELWGRNADARLFEQHSRAVTRFLAEQLRISGLPPAAGSASKPLTVEEVRTAAGGTGNLLTFELMAGCRIIPWPDRPLPEVVCSLDVREREGLILLWRSRLEKRFAEDPPHETIISPLVSAIAYDYFDPEFKNWKTETSLRRGDDETYTSPQRIRLTFAYQKMKRETVITLPVPVEGLPNF